MNEIDKRRGRPFEQKKTVIQEIKILMRSHNLILNLKLSGETVYACIRLYTVYIFHMVKNFPLKETSLKSCLNFKRYWTFGRLETYLYMEE